MIEAMSAGTPVIAWRNGSVPEVITPGRSGFIVESIDEAVAAVPQALALDRRTVRAEFEKRFTLQHMAARYISVYEEMLQTRLSVSQQHWLQQRPATSGQRHARVSCDPRLTRHSELASDRDSANLGARAWWLHLCMS